MKKVVCFLVGLTMLFTTAFASNADILSNAIAKTSELTSCSAEITFSTKLNEPLLLLDSIELEEGNPIDLRLLVEELTNATSKLDLAYSTSEDLKKLDFSMSLAYDTPIVLNEDLRIEAWTKISLWMSYDITDSENPVYKIIAKVPFVDKYQVLDLSYLIKNYPEMFNMTDKDAANDFQKKIMDVLFKKADITSIGNQYTLTLDDEGAKEYLKEALIIYKDYIKQNSGPNYESYEMIEKTIDGIAEVFDKTTLLGENGLKITFTKNNEGIITAQVEELHILLNVFDILQAYEKSTEGLTRDEAYIDMIFKSESKTSNHNKAEVIFPELNEENSAYIDMSYGINNMYIISDESPVFKNDRVYFPVESIADHDKLNLTTDIKDNEIAITYPDGETVSINDKTVTQSGEESEFDFPPVFVENGKVYCSEEFLYPLNIMIVNTYYDFNSNKFKFKYQYLPSEDSIEFDDSSYEAEIYEPTEEYVPPRFYYDFFVPRETYTNNGIVYMPVYEFVEALFLGEFSYGDGSITYTALEENNFNIQTINVNKGDSFVTINGEKRPLNAAAAEVDGILYIPVSFTKELGINDGYVETRYNMGGDVYTYYHFNMTNPDYVESAYNTYSPSLYVFVSSDRTPYVENNEVYIPAYELFESMFKGEFAFYENGMEYVALGKNRYDIEKISISVGDNFVTVNDEKIEFENNVVSVDDVIRVPVSFMEKLGFTTENIGYGYGDSSYSFSIDNPNYMNNKEDSIYNNWFYKLFQ